jgi:hypothetical protein
VSATLDQKRISILENALYVQKAWIRHWMEDKKDNLPPTDLSLRDALDELDAALNQREKQNA